jgi:hypothetical protein
MATFMDSPQDQWLKAAREVLALLSNEAKFSLAHEIRSELNMALLEKGKVVPDNDLQGMKRAVRELLEGLELPYRDEAQGSFGVKELDMFKTEVTKIKWDTKNGEPTWMKGVNGIVGLIGSAARAEGVNEVVYQAVGNQIRFRLYEAHKLCPYQPIKPRP